MMNFIHAFDYALLEFYHNLAVMTNNAFTPFIRSISYFFDLEKGLPLVIIAIALLFFKKTRKVGFVMVVSMVIGLIFTNLFIKNYVARLRPFQSGRLEIVNWWKYVGSVHVGEYSFPSGHATATMAAMTAIFLTCNKKYSWLGFLFVLLMGFSRNYLMVHYPSDVVAGMLVGLVSALLAYGLYWALKSYTYSHLDHHWCQRLYYSGLFE